MSIPHLMSISKILPVLLIGCILGYYFFWLITERKRSAHIRSKFSSLSDQDFLKYQIFSDNSIPDRVILSFKYFFESAYSLENSHLVAPDMTLTDLSSISPASPMTDDIEVCFLLRKLEAMDKRYADTLQNGTLAEIILMCWKLGINVKPSCLQ